MVFNDIEQKTFDKAVAAFMEKHRPPEHIRDQLDVGCRLTGQSLTVFEIRPQWNDPSNILEHPLAKATFVKTQNVWKIYWLRGNLKWAAYDPVPTVKTVAAFLDVVDKDEFACFWG
jgi:Protein of unknown function (DUF3024)